jgi:hypothetical protein
MSVRVTLVTICLLVCDSIVQAITQTKDYMKTTEFNFLRILAKLKRQILSRARAAVQFVNNESR